MLTLERMAEGREVVSAEDDCYILVLIIIIIICLLSLWMTATQT